MQPQEKQGEETSDYGEVLGPATLRIKRLLSATPEKVWGYLTESEKSAQWLAAINGELKDGGQFELEFNHKRLSPDEVVPDEFKEHGCHNLSARVLTCDPYNKLSYTWGSDENPSEVTIELEEQGDKTLLTLTHAKLRDSGQMLSVSGGWHSHLNTLRDKLEGKEQAPFWDTLLKVREEYRGMIKGE